MKKILGLDLGSSSIGWAYICIGEGKHEIINMGVRLIPLTVDEKGEFEAGNAITKNSKRTMKRTIRKGYDRYQSRRTGLKKELAKLSMLPDESLMLYTNSLALYELRDKGIRDKLSLTEVGRVLYHLNQKRGYKSLRGTEGDSEDGKKVTDYEKEINDRYGYIQQQGITIGQFFYQQLLKDSFARLKQQVFPRHAYIEEYNALMKKQQSFYPDIITDEMIDKLRDQNIYHQRPLKSKKGLVSICEFAGHKRTDPKTGKVTLVGPRVAPRSSPLFEVGRIWESINSISIKDRNKEKRPLTIEEKQMLFDELSKTELLKQKGIFKLLGIKDKDYTADELTHEKGIKGSNTKCQIAKALGEDGIYDKWLQFDLKLTDRVNKSTGEVTKEIDPQFELQPLYQLWHILYSVREKEVLLPKLIDKFGFDEETAKRLMRLDFTKSGFGNKSARAIRSILPSLLEGNVYSDAMAYAGINHSNSKTKEQAAAIATIDKLEPIEKNSLRQPVVEKVLNQLINVVNAIIADPAMGKPDEIRIELARNLKQSKEERNRSYKTNNVRDRENKEIIKRLEEYGIRGSRKNIEHYRLWQEWNELSVYGPYNPERKVGFAQAFGGAYDIDHIIPQSRLFDDSFANKVFCSRKQNEDKGNKTAYDYMKSMGEETFQTYLSKIEELYKNQVISRGKRDRLLMSAEEIPKEFISRQLNETRYIVKKAKEILAPLLREKEHDIICTSGSVTAFLRHEWGWDNILVNLNYDKYPDGKKTNEPDETGRKRKKIDNWSKRDDHRHHAIDALTIAFTDRSVIQRMNDLNQIAGAETKLDENLKAYAQKIKPYATKDVEGHVSSILISLKPGKKVASRSINKKAGNQITLTPRGSLSEESVYGSINLKGKQEYVLKYKLGIDFKLKDLDYIIDKGLRSAIEKRLAQYNNDPKLAFRDIEANPVWFNEKHKIPIRSIRMRTNLSIVEPVKYDVFGKSIGFVKPGSNHHIAIYENEKGRRSETVVTFWEAVLRKKEGLPIIDKHPSNGSIFITSLQQNEMFIFNMTKSDIESAIVNNDHATLSKNLFRVMNLTEGIYWFNHHLETQPKGTLDDKKAGRCIQASKSSMTGIKVRINHLGVITKVGE
jgi:CRISPR-associated endonuclease Csn1